MLSAIWHTSLAFAPYLLLGAVLSGILHVALPANWLKTHLQGRWGVLKAVAFGVPLPLCSCGVIPAGLGLRRDGASRGATVGFMISTPQTGVDSILVSASMLGVPFAIFKVAAALITGAVGGLLTQTLIPDVPAVSTPSAESGGGRRTALRRGLGHSLMILQSVWRWVFVGIVVSAALDRLVPPSVWASVSAVDPLLSMLAALAVAAPLYVCATASVPIAASLVAGGLPAGAALVFLMAGPATNVATIGAMYRVLGLRTVAIYLFVVVAFSMAFGLTFDAILPTAATVSHVHGDATWWESGASAAMWLLMMYFAVTELRAFFAARGKPSVPAQVTIEMDVEGMSCKGCVRKLRQALEGDRRVTAAAVTLEPQHIQVCGKVSPAEVRALVEGAGFRVRASV